MLAIALSLLGAEPPAEHPAEHPGEDYAARSVRGAGLVLWHSNVSFFNTAYTWNAAARTWVGITRPMANPTQAELCGVSFRTTVPVNIFAIVPDARQDAYTALDMLPAAHRCRGIGEPKLVTIGGARFVYGHTHKHCPDAFFNYMSAHGVDTPGRRQMFLASVYRNFLAPLVLPGGKMGTVTPLRPLFWDERPEPHNPTAKNFVFFAREPTPHIVAQVHGCVYARQNANELAVVLLEPNHTVYSLDASGLMRLVCSTPAVFGFPAYLRASLSCGTVHVGPSRALVAGHLGQGRWIGAYRMTFFYIMSTEPPYNPVCATPVVNFGLSETLEYVLHMEQHGELLYVSTGVDNCWSALVALHVDQLARECLPLGRSLARRTSMLKLVNRTLVRRPWQPPEPTVAKRSDRKDGRRSVLRKHGLKTAEKDLPCLGVFCPRKGGRRRRQPRSGSSVPAAALRYHEY